MGGRFNNGGGVNPGLPASSPRVASAMGGGVPVNGNGNGNVGVAAAYALPGVVPAGIQQGQPVDMVERWRQSVMP